jgi:hypothetical protein
LVVANFIDLQTHIFKVNILIRFLNEHVLDLFQSENIIRIVFGLDRLAALLWSLLENAIYIYTESVLWEGLRVPGCLLSMIC